VADRAVVAISEDRRLRVVAALVSETVAEAVRRHRTGALASLALARAVASAALAGIGHKDRSRVALQWVGRGPLRQIHADFRPPGELRAYVGDAQAAVPGGSGAIPATALAPGVVSLIWQERDGRTAHGQVPMEDGSVDRDVEAWLRNSEQVPSRLRVLVDSDAAGRPLAVAGLLVQTLPGAVAGDLAPAPSLLDRSARAGAPLADLLALAVPGGRVEVVAEHALRFFCACSQERVEGGVALLPVDDLQDMVGKAEPAQVRCEFCATEYVVPVERVAAILASKRGGGGGPGGGANGGADGAAGGR
jgi:molecular chaperone Hsp33